MSRNMVETVRIGAEVRTQLLRTWVRRRRLERTAAEVAQAEAWAARFPLTPADARCARAEARIAAVAEMYLDVDIAPVLPLQAPA